MKNKELVIGIYIVIILVLGFMMFNKLSNEEVISDVILTGETKEIIMKAFQFDFDPNIVEVNLGDRVIIKVTSTDVPHGFGIREYNINEYLSPGQEVTIDFIADKKGTFTFYCSVACGGGHGAMRGKLIVND